MYIQKRATEKLGTGHYELAEASYKTESVHSEFGHCGRNLCSLLVTICHSGEVNYSTVGKTLLLILRYSRYKTRRNEGEFLPRSPPAKAKPNDNNLDAPKDSEII